MVVTVVVTGVPRLMSLKNLAVEFNEVLEDDDLGDFRIRDIALSNNKKFKRQVALDFESGFDAMMVQEKLDGFEFITSGGSCNIIKAKILTAEDEPEPSTEVVISTSARSDYYEPYVEHVNESLDVEIDLLKKQTLALKAHRKLIREQKKLKKEFTKLDADSDNETPEISKRRKRKRLRSTDSGSSDSFDRSKLRDNLSPPNSPEHHKSSKSETCEDYLAIKYKKISTTRRSKSRKAQTRGRSVARSKSREKPSRISESYKHRSRSRSREKRKAAYCAIEYKKSTHIRESNSPEPRSHRVVRSKSRGTHRSPSRTFGTRERRSRSRDRKKYYSLETIEYKKALLTETKPQKLRSKYESTEQCVFRSTSSKQLRSPSPHKGHTRSRIDSRKRKTSRSRSRSNSIFQLRLTKTADVECRSNTYKNRSPSVETRSMMHERSRHKYNNDSFSKSEYNSSKALDSQRKTTKVAVSRKHPDRENVIKLNAKIQSTKMQAMEDVLLEMELLQRQERYTISNTDKMFLTDLVKGIVKSRFQNLHVDGNMTVRDIVTRYRSQYSKGDDITLLRNLAGECKSLDGVTSTVVAVSTAVADSTTVAECTTVAESTANVPDLQSKNDEIWTAVDEVLDGVDIDLLQAEPETNEVEDSENSKNMPNLIEMTQVNSSSITEEENNTTCVSVGRENPKITINKAKNSRVNIIDLTSDTINKNENIKSSEALINTKASIHNLAIVLTDTKAAGTKVNVSNTNCDITFPTKTHVSDNNMQKSVKIESIELSDDSDSGMDNNITRDNTPMDSVLSIHLTDVVSLAKKEKPIQNIISNSITKENLLTVDLTDDTDNIEINYGQINIASSATHLLNPIKKEIVSDMTHDQSNFALSTKTTQIKQENVEFDGIGTHHDESLVSILDSNVVKSIKKEKVATDEYDHNVLSETYLISTIKKEPEIDSTDYPDKPEINNEQNQDTILDIHILRSIKAEQEITVPNKLTNYDLATKMKKDSSIPVIISNCLKKGNVTAVDDSVSQTKTPDTNNDQITMPVPIILSSVKREDVATEDSISPSQSYVTDINNYLMPGPIKQSCIKQEDEASTKDTTSLSELMDINNCQITMPVPIDVSSVKNEDKVIINSDSLSQTVVTDINNDKIQINRTIEPNCMENDSTIQSGITDDDIDQISMIFPTVSSGKITDIGIVSDKKHEIKRREDKDDSINHKQERHSSREVEENIIKHTKDKDISEKHKEDRDGSIKSKNNQGSQIKQKNEATIKKDLTNCEEIKCSTDVLKISEPVISESLDMKEQQENNKEKNLKIVNKVLPRNPQFIIPTRIVMRSMKTLIKNNYNDYNEHGFMLIIIRKVLQHRFRDLLKDKGYVKANEIVKMYKEFYAEEKYTDFLSGIVARIKAGKYDDEINKNALRQDKVEKKILSTSEENQKNTIVT